MTAMLTPELNELSPEYLIASDTKISDESKVRIVSTNWSALYDVPLVKRV